MIAQRILAILAAFFLVTAVGMATLEPPELPLGQMLFMIDGSFMDSVEQVMQHRISPWIWSHVAVPLLVRPAWLIPAALGIVLAGLAFTLAPRRGASRPRRRN